MRSSRMRTGRSLTVCRSLLPGRGVSALGGCLLRGVSAPGGVCSRGCLLRGVSAPGGVCSGGCLLRGVSVPGWVSAPRGCLLQGVSAQGDVVSQHALRQTPPCEQNDKQVQKYYLGHNFVAAGNKVQPSYIGVFQV